MKKLLSLFIVCFCHVAVAYDPCCAPCTNYCNPCDDWCGSGCCMGCGCRSGFYVGAHVGYAWIQTPDCGKFDFEESGEYYAVSNGHNSCCSHHCNTCGDHGDFAWGVFGGWNTCMCCENLYVGIEGGYHHNGCSKLHFREHINGYDYNGHDSDYRHHCELSSHDWNISATLDYMFCDCFDAFVKIGGARVCEKFKGHNKCKDHDCDSCGCNGHSNGYGTSYLHFCNNCAHEWAPVLDVGGGYSFWNCLRATISYRGVFCDCHNHVRDAFKICEDSDGHLRLKLRNCSTVHALYGGVAYTF